MHMTIMKIKNHKKKITNFSFKFKIYIYIYILFKKYNYMNKIFSKINFKFDLKYFHSIVLLCCHQTMNMNKYYNTTSCILCKL